MIAPECPLDGARGRKEAHANMDSDLRFARSRAGQWCDDGVAWTELPRPWPDGALGWSHTDVAVTGDGYLVTAPPEGGGLVWVAPDGTWSACPLPIVDGHGLAVVADPAGDTVWVADNGTKLVAEPQGKYTVNGSGAGQVLHVDRAGTVLGRLPKPHTPAFKDKDFMPTAVALADGPGGPIWVADGYGSSALHRYSTTGELQRTVTGEGTQLGAFDCPHAMVVDLRRPDPVLYVTDRGSNRLAVLDLDGSLIRIVSDADLIMPSALAAYDDVLVVAELTGRLTVLDTDDRVVGRLGDNTAATSRPGWPNAISPDGVPVQPDVLRVDRFNSPHGVTVDRDGRLVVTEWVMGGRLLALAPKPA